MDFLAIFTRMQTFAKKMSLFLLTFSSDDLDKSASSLLLFCGASLSSISLVCVFFFLIKCFFLFVLCYRNRFSHTHGHKISGFFCF